MQIIGRSQPIIYCYMFPDIKFLQTIDMVYGLCFNIQNMIFGRTYGGDRPPPTLFAT